jgi:hypothetical protein
MKQYKACVIILSTQPYRKKLTQRHSQLIVDCPTISDYSLSMHHYVSHGGAILKLNLYSFLGTFETLSNILTYSTKSNHFILLHVIDNKSSMNITKFVEPFGINRLVITYIYMY